MSRLTKILFAFAFCLLFVCINLPAQEVPYSIIEDVLAEPAEEYNGEFNDDDLELFYKVKKINSISDNVILSLPYLSMFQKYSIINYRKKWGDIFSPAELMLLDGFDNDIVAKILPYLDFSPRDAKVKYSFRDFFTHADYDLMLRFSADNQQKEEYYTDDIAKKYLGDRHKMLLKFKYDLEDKLRIGVTMEKDAGEAIYTANNGSFRIENLSGFVMWQSRYVNILLGDYYVQFGQGLSMWNSSFFHSGVESQSLLRTQKSLKPKTGSEEVNFLRGAAVDMTFGNLNLMLYGSLKKIDASVEYDEQLESYYFNSFYTSGYHRTYNELLKVNAVSQSALGGYAALRLNRQTFTANFNYVKYNIPFVPENSFANIHKWSGKDNYSYSLSYLNVFRFSYLYGECALSQNQGASALVGWFAHANSFVDVDITLKCANSSYHSNSALNVSDSKDGNSLTVKLMLHPSRKLSIFSLLTLTKNKWYSSSRPAISPTTSFSTRSKYKFSDYLSVFFDYSFDRKIEKLANEYVMIVKSLCYNRHKFRFNVEVKPFQFLTLRSRLDYLVVDDEKGCLLYNDFALRFENGFSFICRLTCYDTDGYKVRVYSYENDVIHNFSSPAYYGIGCSAFFLVKAEFMQSLSVWLKFWANRTFDRLSDKINTTLMLNYKF